MITWTEQRLREPHDIDDQLAWNIKTEGDELTALFGLPVDHGYGPRWECPVIWSHGHSIGIHPYPDDATWQVVCTEGCESAFIKLLKNLYALARAVDGYRNMRRTAKSIGLTWDRFGYTVNPEWEGPDSSGEAST